MQSRMSGIEIANRFTPTTDAQTHKHTILIDEDLNIVQKLLKTMLVQTFCPDVCQVGLRGDVVGSDIVFFDQLTDVEGSQRVVFSTRTECPVTDDMKWSRVVYVQRHFIARADATSLASVVDITVSL